MVSATVRTSLVRICDLAGRERGTGFAADALGTLVTSHETVDGLSRVVVHAPGERTRLVESAHITPLPEWDLALLHTEGLGLTPLVTGAERARPEGTPVRLWEDGWLDARISGTTPATYTSTERFHPLDDVLVLDVPREAATRLRLSRRASGSPVLDAETGAVLAVLGTALHAPGGGFAAYGVQPRVLAPLEPGGPLARLLARNGVTVPGFGPDLNLAGTLRLTEGCAGPIADGARKPTVRPEVVDELRSFGNSGASVTALVGEPGTGRTTELAAFAARRSRGVAPAPSVWLRGADLRADDAGVRDAVGRALTAADRDVRSGGGSERSGGGSVNADVVARLARDAGRSLVVLLDAPEELPPELAHGLRRWTLSTSGWLRAAGARLVLACRPEFWERAGALFPAEMLHVPGGGADVSAVGARGRSAAVLPPCLRIGDLPPRQAARVRAYHGLPDGALTPADAGHPLAVRVLAEIRAAQRPGDDRAPGGAQAPGGDAGDGAAADAAAAAPAHGRRPPPSRGEVFAVHLDLLALRVAVRLGRTARPGGAAPAAVRRLAVRVAGQLHEAARRCLGPGEGALDRAGFEELFPRGGGWAAAVLAEGVLTAAGDGYRFADEEFGEWLQGRHLGLDAALESLVRPADRRAALPVTVPRHRIGPVVQALLQTADHPGPLTLARHLLGLVRALPGADAPPRAVGATGGPYAPRAPGGSGVRDGAGPSWAVVPYGPTAPADPERAWWAAHLLGETLLRLPDATPYLRVLTALADHIAASGGTGDFGPWFWRRLPLGTADRIGLLRRLLPTDAPYDAARPGGRHLDAVGALLAAEPHTVRPLLCDWFDDERPLAAPVPAPARSGEPAPTVAAAALALLHTHRRPDTDALADMLVGVDHPRAAELLAELARDEPASMCRAVERWARDRRPERRAAAAAYGLRTARHVRTDTGRELLRLAALELLRRPGDQPSAPALALLVRDPASRARHLDEALAHFADTGSPVLASAFGAALATHPEPVFAALRDGPRGPSGVAARDGGVALLLRALAELPGAGGRTGARPGTGPGTAARLAALVRERADHGRPRGAGEAVAAFVGRRLDQGAAARGVLVPLADAVARARNAAVRAPLGEVLGAGRGPLRDELLTVLLGRERDPVVLDGVLDATVRAHGADTPAEEVRRAGLLMARTPRGAALLARRTAALSRDVPGFAERLRSWSAADPGAWAALGAPGAPALPPAPAGA
ncbi:trypsin-like peptidase domain-containing protein [Streptomyces sp. Z26]|uniref:trypsin-like peptidase domain-containing protein n=1 Tax=Streptomyces sp. Z26 TaxID=2500177 RepID=UPI000EF14FC4|nr:trypsin-like peptidase domain-containing protein [Streptomyces sp. Z26]RLL69143.1 serine protease [Streptomyces sp. Z26]